MKISAKNDQFQQEFREILQKSGNSPKVSKIMRKSAKFQFRAVRRCAGSCRSRKMLKNEYLLAKIGVDTGKNELSEILKSVVENVRQRALLLLRG